MMKKLTENLSPITKKVDEVNPSTRNLGEVRRGSKSKNENIQEIVPVEMIQINQRVIIPNLL